MKLSKMTKEELELLSYTKIAEMYLKENKSPKNTKELFTAICNLLELSETEYQDKIADFFESLTTSKEFILLEDGTWDLKANHIVKIQMDDIYEEKDDLEEENEEDEIDIEVEEEDDLDAVDTDDYLDDDDDLAELTIVSDEELED